jgi:hypothetical protein
LRFCTDILREDETEEIPPANANTPLLEDQEEEDNEEEEESEDHRVLEIKLKDLEEKDSTKQQIKKVVLTILSPFVEVLHFSSKETGKDHYMAIFIIGTSLNTRLN